MKSWVTRYLNIPFKERGRTRAGVDCYGLVRLIYQEQRHIELPSYTEHYATTADYEEITALVRGEAGSKWHEILLAHATTYDGLIFRLVGQPTHFGLVLDPPWFIHAIKRDRQTVGRTWMERWDTTEWRHRLVAAVRWQGA
jgi:cell wall-associated NlpC family hydrolase